MINVIVFGILYVYFCLMIHFKLDNGIIFALTDTNERVLKCLLYELYKAETMIEIIETEERLQLNDIFSENTSET